MNLLFSEFVGIWHKEYRYIIDSHSSRTPVCCLVNPSHYITARQVTLSHVLKKFSPLYTPNYSWENPPCDLISKLNHQNTTSNKSWEMQLFYSLTWFWPRVTPPYWYRVGYFPTQIWLFFGLLYRFLGLTHSTPSMTHAGKFYGASFVVLPGCCVCLATTP